MFPNVAYAQNPPLHLAELKEEIGGIIDASCFAAACTTFEQLIFRL